MESEEERRDREYNAAFKVLQKELRQEKNVKLTGDVEADFPELLEDDIDFDDKTNEYLKKHMIEELIDNVEVKKDNSIYDKRLKRPLLKRIADALFGQ
jgi:LPS O-antigen subunit length determinant protein (WzzB/FepE family)